MELERRRRRHRPRRRARLLADPAARRSRVSLGAKALSGPKHDASPVKLDVGVGDGTLRHRRHAADRAARLRRQDHAPRARRARRSSTPSARIAPNVLQVAKLDADVDVDARLDGADGRRRHASRARLGVVGPLDGVRRRIRGRSPLGAKTHRRRDAGRHRAGRAREGGLREPPDGRRPRRHRRRCALRRASRVPRRASCCRRSRRRRPPLHRRPPAQSPRPLRRRRRHRARVDGDREVERREDPRGRPRSTCMDRTTSRSTSTRSIRSSATSSSSRCRISRSRRSTSRRRARRRARITVTALTKKSDVDDRREGPRAHARSTRT